ncbi:MAG: regulatory protein RecX [Flavobacteriales bacterium Tduv]
MVKQILSTEDVKKKLIRYCNFQERCKQEIEEKLNQFNLGPQENDIILKYLVDHNLVNEDRFSKIFTLSRIRYKKWGKEKIAHALRSKSIPETLIEEAWKTINPEEYKKMLYLLIKKKLGKIPGKFTVRKRDRIHRFLISKGYEDTLIQDTIREYFSCPIKIP